MKKRKSKYTPGGYSLAVRRATTGRGIFALEEIPKGACILRYSGRRVSAEEEETSRGGKYFFEVMRGYTIDGNVPTNKARYINHSCRPNCEADGPRDKVFIMSARRIKAGEELTYDYGKEYFKEYLSQGRCRCPKCRHT